MPEEITLDQVGGWPEAAIGKLKMLGITTARQVVSKASVPGGVAALAAHLGMTEEETRRAIDAARSRLSPDEARGLEARVDTGTMGLGALPLPKGGGGENPAHPPTPGAPRILDLPDEGAT